MRLFVIGLLIGSLFTPPLTAEENPRLVQRTVVYWALQSSVVLVQLLPTTPPRENPFCAGVVLRPDLVLTAAHCIQERKFSVRSFSGETAQVKEMRLCIECDLGLVYLESPLVNARPASLSEDVAVGDTLYLVGAPDDTPFIVTHGIIAKIAPAYQFSNKCYPSSRIGLKPQQTLFTDAHTFFGNSGGPAFDDRGNLIGILTRLNTASDTCMYTGEHILWGMAVGPLAVKAFLESGK